MEEGACGKAGVRQYELTSGRNCAKTHLQTVKDVQGEGMQAASYRATVCLCHAPTNLRSHITEYVAQLVSACSSNRIGTALGVGRGRFFKPNEYEKNEYESQPFGLLAKKSGNCQRQHVAKGGSKLRGGTREGGYGYGYECRTRYGWGRRVVIVPNKATRYVCGEKVQSSQHNWREYSNQQTTRGQTITLTSRPTNTAQGDGG